MKWSPILTCCFLTLVLSTNNSSASQIEKSDSLSKSEWFDFWVGEWDLTWHHEDGRTGKGYNHISKILDDKVIQEQFKVLNDTSMEGFKGRSMSVFNPNTNEWHQAWVDNSGGYFDFTGEKDGDKRIFKTRVFERGGKKIQLRMIFYDISYETFTWDWMVSRDGGEEWEVLWRIHYKRKE